MEKQCSRLLLLEGQMFQVSPWVTVAMTRVVTAKLCCDVITMMIDGGDDDDENSDVGNDFHCGSYDDSIDVWYHLG